MQDDIILKICIMGEPGVGKTSMLYQYVYNQFNPTTKATIGCDFATKVKSSQNGVTYRLQLWDIAGQQRFNAVTKIYIRGALGCLIVFSAQQKNTLDESLRWKKLFDQECDRFEDQIQPIPTILVQNKIDLLRNKNLQPFQTKSYLQQFAKDNNFSGFCATSAKDNKNIEEAFGIILDIIIKSGLIKFNKNQDQKKLNKNNQQSKSCC